MANGRIMTKRVFTSRLKINMTNTIIVYAVRTNGEVFFNPNVQR